MATLTQIDNIKFTSNRVILRVNSESKQSTEIYLRKFDILPYNCWECFRPSILKPWNQMKSSFKKY